ncbi:MAG: aminotransferase class III-fold pyridoxal phosphate-dependent enzyme, partial [Rhodobiaceae bacterium]|nr:aminotransferase class III-fold pyridoxal phosphate-dependent enzyme [Rhodobiaceae bacterium]
EVMCGMGRTGHLFACEEDGVAPDMITIAKGLGAGYQPIGAMLCRAAIYEAIASGSGFFQHGHTYMGHPLAAAAACAVLKRITRDGLLDNVVDKGAKLDARLNEVFGQHAHVGDIRGRGLFRGVEFVEDRETKKPFDPKRGVAKALKKAAFEAGLICYPMGGTIDGVRGDHVLLAPPFIVTDDQIGEIVEKLGVAIETAVWAGTSG